VLTVSIANILIGFVFQFEKQCAEYSFQVEQLSDRLEECGGASSIQV